MRQAYVISLGNILTSQKSFFDLQVVIISHTVIIVNIKVGTSGILSK